MKPLKILSASAGSGKTYNLVQQFLKLTISNEQKSAFSNIVAMTFTNKASLEMKERIIDALDLLSYGNRKSEKETKKRKALLEATALNLKMDPLDVEKRAKKVLTEILHRYEDFTVLTIDKFSLRLIRTFAKDLDLQQDFNVVLEETILLEQVVDQILSAIGKKENEKLTGLAVQYAKSNLEEGDKWNFRTNLVDFSKVLINEKNKDFVKRILATEYDENSYKALKIELDQVKSKYEKEKKAYTDYFDSLGLTKTDLPGGLKGLFGFATDKLKTKELKDCGKAITKTIADTLSGENVKEKHAYNGELATKTEQYFTAEKACYERYFLINSLRKNFYNLALLKHVGKELEAIKKNENIIRISEFNEMISELISNETAPYIYERIGAKFSHYLLDEFQDTSRLQWLNLIPLVHDSIAEGKENLIVGDPKQAIYRFRNGLVEQFIELPRIYNPQGDKQIAQLSNYFEQQGEEIPLKQNWRSDKNIVKFNNLFFPAFSNALPEYMQEAYKDVKQEPKGNNGGYVEFKRHNEKTNLNGDFIDIEHENLLNWIRECEADGFQRGDICLLARNKKDGARWAQFLTKQKDGFKIVSVDSLAVGADKTIQLFIDYLNLRRNFSNRTKQTQFAVSYFVQQKLDPLVYLKDYWKEKVGVLDIDKFTLDFFESRTSLIFNYDNLYDLGQRFSRLFKVDELTNPYLHHLMEMLQQYDMNNGPDIRGFLEFWELKGKKETVQVPENSEAIKIMTAHQSKGLEFPIVILPRLAWKLDIKDKFFIEEDDELLYTGLAKKDKPNYITKQHEDEFSRILLDETNLLYVAMTRPVQRLYVNLHAHASDRLDTRVLKVLDDINDENFKTNNDTINTTYTFGEKEPNKDEAEDEDPLFEPQSVQDLLWFPEISLQDKDALETEDLSIEQRYGNQLHLILGEVDCIEELDHTIHQMKQKDLLERELFDALIKDARKVLTNTDYLALQQKARKVLNEQEIILDKTDVKRPDKMFVIDNGICILDFKTGEPKEKDEKQIRNYAFALKELGIKDVSGSLFYTKLNEVRKVL